MSIQIGAGPTKSLLDDPLALFYACHRRVEFFLTSLLNVTQAAQGKTLNLEQKNALKSALRYFQEAAPLHTLDEEASLFPRLEKLQKRKTKTFLNTLQQLKQEHHQAEKDHKRVDQSIGDWLKQDKLPAKTYRDLSETLKNLSDFYETHIQIEEETVFPFAQKMLTPSEIKSIGREMALRRGLDPDALKAVTAHLRQFSRPA